MKSQINSLQEFFLKTGREDKIKIDWALDNHDYLYNFFPKAFARFFPDEDKVLEDEAADNMHYMQSTMGRGVM